MRMLRIDFISAEIQSSTMDKPHKIVHLPNGLTLLLVSALGSGLAYVEFQTLAGRFLEERTEAAHSLEHHMGHLTSRKNPSAKKIGRKLEDAGIDGNAFVDNYVARYYLRGKKRDLDFMLETLAQVFAHFEIDESIFRQERNAVVAELADKKLDPWVELENRIDRILFPQHPASQTYSERIKSARSLTQSDLMREYKKLYRTQDTVFTLVADETLDKLEALALPELKSIAKSRRSADFSRAPRKAKLPRVTHVSIDDTLAQVQVIYRVDFKKYNEKRFALEALCSILTNGLTSRLYARLRGEAGLVYSVQCQPVLDPEDAAFSQLIIAAQTQSASVEQVVKLLLEELEEIASKPITTVELSRYRNQLEVSQRELEQTSSLDAYAAQYSDGLLFREKLHDFAQDFKSRLAVDKSEIQSVADEILQPRNLLIAYASGRNVTPALKKYVT